MRKVEQIYQAVMGMYASEHDYIIGGQQISNMFKEGEACGILYKQVYAANVRICERFGVDKDEDVEMIICALSDIMRLVSMKMYDYGVENA